MLDAFTIRVVRSLALYWCDNPFACDTAEGIRQWWLAPTDDISVEQVNRALAWLCERGPVERLLTADGRSRFRRASGHDDAALRQFAALGELGEAHLSHEEVLSGAEGFPRYGTDSGEDTGRA